jgi:hypothetical protein
LGKLFFILYNLSYIINKWNQPLSIINYTGGIEMSTGIKNEKYRRLSIAALVTGLTGIGIGILYNFLWMLIANLLQKFVSTGIMPFIILPVLGIVLGCAIAAVICGSIDLKRIKNGICGTKGRGFDITGIVLGGLFILIVLWFALGEILMPH